MEFVSDLAAMLRGPPGGARDGAQCANPEWSALRLRLAAAQAARRALLDGAARSAARPGSFGRGAAALLASQSADRPHVNPNDVGDSKSEARKEDGVAARNWAGATRVPG